MAFRAREVPGTFEKRAPESFKVISSFHNFDHLFLNCNKFSFFAEFVLLGNVSADYLSLAVNSNSGSCRRLVISYLELFILL